MIKTAVVVPNWNGKLKIEECLNSLIIQSIKNTIILVDNGSTDGSVSFIKEKFPEVICIELPKNVGFAGGVNRGIKKAIELGFDYVALFNNDAVADKDWLKYMLEDININVGIVTCSFINLDKKKIDSTGDLYTNWGLPFPRGRNENFNNQYYEDIYVFAGSGGASLYRAKIFLEIGFFDEDFFAYYEDVDFSFRAQLSGWKVKYSPNSIAYHDTGSTSKTIKGFTTYQTVKNLPWLYWKNVPTKYLFTIGVRFYFAYLTIFISAIQRGQIWPAFKGLLISIIYLPKKLFERNRIQRSKKVESEYIWSIISHDLPPNAVKLRKIRNKWWGIINKT